MRRACVVLLSRRSFVAKQRIDRAKSSVEPGIRRASSCAGARVVRRVDVDRCETALARHVDADTAKPDNGFGETNRIPRGWIIMGFDRG